MVCAIVNVVSFYTSGLIFGMFQVLVIWWTYARGEGATYF